MRESDFGILFRHWMRANPGKTGAYELKQTGGTSIAFGDLKPHQEAFLEAIRGDTGALIRVIGGGGEPDYVYMRNCPAWVVVKYPGCFVVIDVLAWIRERKEGKRKSLELVRAQAIAAAVVRL